MHNIFKMSYIIDISSQKSIFPVDNVTMSPGGKTLHMANTKSTKKTEIEKSEKGLRNVEETFKI